MMPKGWLPACALGLALLSARQLTAEIHSDFDPGGTYFGGIEGWFNYSGNPGFATATPAGGSTLWLGVKPQQYFGQITSQNWAVPDITVSDWNSNTHLKFDVIVDSLWIPNNAAQQISIEFQTHTGMAGTVNQYATPTIDTSLKNVVQHVSVPLAGMQPFDPTATGWNLSINLNPGYAWEWDPNNPSVQPYDPRYYIDNVRFVPEPSSLLLFAFGAVGIAPRIRRRARGGR
jgi:hypothetical protein